MHWEIHPPTHQGEPLFEPLPDFPAGLLYGYCVYTTFKLPLSQAWLMAHLARLEHDARRLGMTWHFAPEQIAEGLQRQIQPDLPVVRLTLIPDVTQYGDLYQKVTVPGRLLLSRRAAPNPTAPVSLKLVHYTRLLPEIKMGAIGELIFLKRQAQAEGFNDILLVNQQGHLSEASTANLFLIRQGQLLIPHPGIDGCLPGITRLRILEAADALGLVIQEGSITPAELATMNGAFLTNAAQGVIPVQRINAFLLPWPDEATTLLNRLIALIQ